MHPVQHQNHLEQLLAWAKRVPKVAADVAREKESKESLPPRNKNVFIWRRVTGTPLIGLVGSCAKHSMRAIARRLSVKVEA